MKKIYYLKQEVKIGDIIDIDGFKVQITQRVIDDNPDKFVLKEGLTDKQQRILNEAKVKYPVGSKVKLMRLNIGGDFGNEVRWSQFNFYERPLQLYVDNNLLIHEEGQWAEIIPNEKTLEDYENELLHDDERGANVCGIEIKNSLFYAMMKFMDRKLYWLKVLQLIADDLNDGWEPDWSDIMQDKVCIVQSNDADTNTHWSYNHGVVFFKSKDIARKAIKIMGDNLKYIYGNI